MKDSSCGLIPLCKDIHVKSAKTALARATTLLLLFVVMLSPCLLLSSELRLAAAQAKDHIGEVATVCGVVASAKYAASSPGRPTFLNLDKPYPTQVFTVVILGENRAKFDKPEVDYKGKTICVTGKIGSYRGVPQVEAKEPEQIKVMRSKIVCVRGKLTAEGVECQALRGADGALYTLMGDLKDFKAGDKVCVTGTVVEVSFCMQGITFSINWIGKCR